MNQQHFFQSFFGPQNLQTEQQKPEYIIHNEVILEITNNWTYAQDLMKRYKDGKLQQIDQLEQFWFNFILHNKIDIFLYQNEEEFLKTLWKIPDN